MEVGRSTGLDQPPCATAKPTAAQTQPDPASEPRCPLVCPAGAKWTAAVVEISPWHSHGEADFSSASVDEDPAGARVLPELLELVLCWMSEEEATGGPAFLFTRPLTSVLCLCNVWDIFLTTLVVACATLQPFRLFTHPAETGPVLH